MHRKNTGATYIAGSRLTTRSGRGVAKWAASGAAAFLALFILVSSLGISPLVAYATGEDPNGASSSQQAQENATNTIKGLDPGLSSSDKTGSYLLDQVGSYDDSGNVSTFQGLLWSIFGLRYINKVSHANVPASTAATAASLGLSNPSASVYACNTSQLGAGTAYYHNCDIPNLMTEFLQDSFSLFDHTGVQGGAAQSAYAGNLFGIPKNLPGDGSVPVNPDFRSQKYTGLELYGYSLPWTTYLGEWDHIKTQTEARLLSNFGFFDHIALAGSAIGGSIANGLTVAVDNFSSQLNSTGNIFQAIGGFYSGYYQGAAAGAIAPILDSSDLNVILSFAWYRIGYANTAYGLRQLTDTEIAASIRLTFLQMMAQSSPDASVLSQSMKDVANGGKPPRKPISKCEILPVTVSKDGTASAGTLTENTPPTSKQMDDPAYTGLLQNDCQAIAQANYKLWINASNYDKKDPAGNLGTTVNDFFKYSADGNRKADTVGTWKTWNADTLSTAAGLGIDCSSTYPNDAALADSIWVAFANCWGGTVPGGPNPGTGYTGGKPAGTVDSPYAWNTAANDEYEAHQGSINTDWIANVLSQNMVQSFMQSHQAEMNFNAPWKRYICLNPDGTDMKTAKDGLSMFVYAFTADGKVNPACNREFRAPIQNGLFGSGYTGGKNQKPANDTRHISNFGDPIGIIVAGVMNQLSTQVETAMTTVGQFATSVSSEVISWTYMPILDSLGITTIIVGLIEGFRDSLFFPLASMVIALAAVSILWKAFKNQAYREGFVSVIMIALIYLSGAFLMYKTTDVVALTQDIPATVEEAIVGTIFSASNVGTDQLCTSTAGSVSTSGNIFGKLADTSASQSTRELLCYNWRTFVFTPWVYGQFGAGFDKLYAKGASELPAGSSTWTNTNGKLVGTAGVNMGNGTIVNNWALYQLNTIKTGTSTTANPSIADGRTDPNMYRIVDAQFGPNNGAGTDSTYAKAWSGADQGSRFQIALLSPILAIFGAVVVISYAITKIVITLLATLMLVFVPFAFLLGLFPSKRAKLKDYLLSIVGLMIQRIVLILVLSIFFVLLLTFAGSGQGSYMNTFLMGMLTCLVFWGWRKEIMGYVFSSIGNPQFGQQWRDNPGAAMREWPILKTAMQKVDQLSQARTAITSAAIGSVLSGRAPVTIGRDEYGKLKIGGAVATELKARNELLFRKQRRREGFDGLRSGLISARQVAKETKTKAELDPETQAALNELFQGSAAAYPGAANPEDDLAAQREAFNILADTPGFRKIAMPVMNNDNPVKDEFGEQVYKNIIVADADPTKEIAQEPASEIDEYSKLQKPQDRRLAQQYKEFERESLSTREARLEYREKALADPDPRFRQAYTKYSSLEAIPSLQSFYNETDVKKKAAVVKNLAASVNTDLEGVFKEIDAALSDDDGFTDGDRKRAKKLIKATVKENLKQVGAEYQMDRIKNHLQFVAKEEYAASHPRQAAQKAIRDMTKLSSPKEKRDSDG